MQETEEDDVIHGLEVYLLFEPELSSFYSRTVKKKTFSKTNNQQIHTT